MKTSLLPTGLKQRVLVAVCLMSIFPLLVLGYVVSTFVLPNVRTFWDLWVVIAMSVLLAALGFGVVRGLVAPVVRLAGQAQDFAQGKRIRPVEIQAPGEVGELSAALNLITRRARENMDQLRAYGEQTHRLNMEINQRMLALSNILQISSLITQAAGPGEVLDMVLEKLSQMGETGFNCILEPGPDGRSLHVKAVSSANRSRAGDLLNKKISDPWLQRILEERQMRVVDAGSASPHERELTQQLFGVSNAIYQPLVCMGNPAALLVSANWKEGFSFREDTLELVGVFGKQAGIAMENDVLSRRAKELEIKDELTGLYNGSYIRNRVEEEVRRACRYNRPCSVVLLDVDGFRKFQEECGGLAGEKALISLAQAISERVTEVDRLGRVGEDEFILVLPEKNKREAIELAEAIRAQIGMTPFSTNTPKGQRTLTVSAGVSENPIDGSTGQELLAKADKALGEAKNQGKNRVVAA